jgi:hypothetical protein
MHSKLPTSMDLLACDECTVPLALIAAICALRSRTNKPSVIVATLITVSIMATEQPFPLHFRIYLLKTSAGACVPTRPDVNPMPVGNTSLCHGMT